MISLILLLISFNANAMECPKTREINKSKEAWTDQDRSVLKSAKTRCAQLYPEAPCLKSFYKLKPRSYYAHCGRADTPYEDPFK